MSPQTNETTYVIIDGLDCVLLDWNERLNLVPIPSLLPQGDPDWSYTDKAGHLHTPDSSPDAAGVRFVSSYPTLEPVYEEPWYCHDCRDTHQFVDYERCKLCHERIRPRMVPPRDYVIEGQRDITFTVQAGPEQGYEQLLKPNLEVQVTKSMRRYLAVCTSYELRSDQLPTLHYTVIKELP